jgi:capsule polysaccharide export protein KpsE/RkpR
VHRRERGGETEAPRIEALMLRIDSLQADMTRLEQQIGESRQSSGSTGERAATPGAV